jgi:hypothetical protein
VAHTIRGTGGIEKLPEHVSPIGDGQVTGTPPPEVLDALDRAARVLRALDRDQVTLELLIDEGSGLVCVSVSHEDEYGSRELSGAGLLNLLDGDLSEVEC